MELRSLCHLHFIQKVSTDGVTKVVNVSHGRPRLVFKKVTDIYGSEDVLPFNKPSRLCEGDEDQPQVFGSEKIKAEVPDPPTESDHVPDNEDGDASERDTDLDDSISGSMTLNQIKKACKLKKRKRSIPEKVAFHDESISFEAQREDFDLKDTLSMWKFKVKKNNKDKKKRVKKYASSYQNAMVVFKSERIFFERHVPEYDWEMPVPLAIEFDDSDHNRSDYETALCVVGDSSFLDIEPLVSHFLEYDYEPSSEESDECVLDSESSPVLEPGISGAETPEDRISDDLKSASVIAASAPDSSVENNQGSPQAHEPEEECVINTAIQEIPDNVSCFENASHNRNHSADSISSQLHRLGRLSSSQHVENDECDAQTTAGIISESSTEDSPKFADEHVKNADDNMENSPQETPPSDNDAQQTSPKRVESNRFLNVQHSSRRLFTARKVISPTSQEWLCKALKSNEESDEEYFYRCKGVYFKKQRESKFARAIRSNQIRKCELPIIPERTCSNPKSESQESPNSIPISPDRTCSNLKPESQESPNSIGTCSENVVAEQKKDELHGSPNNLSSQIRTKKCSPPKAAAKSSPQVRVTMSCNTTRSCSENAVAFSQRQLQDIETLATRLMGELKSMKDIAEEFSKKKDIAEEASCSGGYTNPDEVRTRIENATKAEETARKWLSIMSRDCNRFCKIMKMSENSRAVPQSPTEVQRGKRKISFADEAGKKLCHIKYFYI